MKHLINHIYHNRTFNFTRGFFCSTIKDHASLLKAQLLSNYKTYRPDKNVSILYQLTRLSSVSDKLPPLQHHYYEDILQNVMSQIHVFPHIILNMLLEVLKDRKDYYDRNRHIFRSLSKNIAGLPLSKLFKEDKALQTVVLTISLKFPKNCVFKIFENLVKENASSKVALPSCPDTQIIKLAIIALEQPYITLFLFRKIQNILLTITINKLHDLTLLYHYTRIFRVCLQRKVKYHLAVAEAKEVMLNPFQSMEINSQKPEEPQINRIQKLSQQLQSQLVIIEEEARKQIDLDKLKKSIVKSMEAEVELPGKEDLLLVAEITELSQITEKYFQEKKYTLTPQEFTQFLKNIPKLNFIDEIESYFKQFSTLMSIQEKCFVFSEAHRYAQMEVGAKEFARILEGVDQINYDDFVALTSLIQKVNQQQNDEIKKILDQIKQRIK